MYYVYTLTDPRDDKVFYVGKGKGNRINDHELQAKKNNVSEKCKRINDIWDSDKSVIKDIVKRFNSEMKAYAYERELIKKIGLDNLTNVTSGGGGLSCIPRIVDEAAQRDIAYLQLFYRIARLQLSNLIPCIRLCGLHEITQDKVDILARKAQEIVNARGEDWANNAVLANR